MFTIRYSKSGHDLSQYARDIYDALGMSVRRYIIVSPHPLRGEEMHALAWTRRGAERKQRRFTAMLARGHQHQML